MYIYVLVNVVARAHFGFSGIVLVSCKINVVAFLQETIFYVVFKSEKEGGTPAKAVDAV